MREELSGARHKEIFQLHVHDDIVFLNFKTRIPLQKAVSGAARILQLAKGFL